ncbi:Ankyrin repeat [Melia azedarach]|uniref:Ankyrin repeat n=2 Tax=Melia azedarach TaxID=155640 RepID=A0ACC1WTG9_MELAZ|nr:Ankyrin repeat [Melia azedarach]KAJ4702503.1 Ankyrin repeat [Melia azedarach]
MYGKVELAQEVMKNNNNIAMIPDNDGTLPIHVAAWIGHKEMVDFLYQKSRHLLEEDSKAELFVSCIERGLYDIASQMLTDYPNLATAEDTDNETALDVLARKNLKEVEKIVPEMYREVRNKEGFTPRALFLKEHQELRKNGEKWMKETANACIVIVVATLTATVAFAAALTVPGGNNQNTGFPIFIEKATFQVFAISDAVSLLFSLTSMTTFLNIFISRYAEEDMLWRLPRKFYIGMLALLISLVALVAMFSTISFIFFNKKSLWAAIVVAIVAPTPLYMLLLRNIGHTVYDVFLMTYNFYSPVQQGRNIGFFQPEASGQHEERKISKLKNQLSCCTNV